jgi:prolyl-tRNA editing enzyme YbaK/EbsC (Cys-tRNA(Pro) deacylase)
MLLERKTNMDTVVTQFLRERGIVHKVKPHSNPVFKSEDAARERGVRLSQIVKCMVGTDPKGRLFAMMIPGDKILKIKRVRVLAGGIKIDLLEPEKLAEKYGVTVGAISPTQFVGTATLYMDESIFREEEVDISSGDPSAGVELKASDLEAALGATRCNIVSTSGEGA